MYKCLQAKRISYTKELDKMKHLSKSKLCIVQFFEVNLCYIYLDKRIIRMKIKVYDYMIMIKNLFTDFYQFSYIISDYLVNNKMKKSPSQKFQRSTTNAVCQNQMRVTQSQKFTSPRKQQDLRHRNNLYMLKQNDQRSEIAAINQQIQNKITNLQTVLEKQKNNRQQELLQFYSAINTLKLQQKNLKEGLEVTFPHEVEPLQTPRMKPRQEIDQKYSTKSHYHTQSPAAYQTVSKKKTRMLENEQISSSKKSFQQFSLKSLEILLRKIQKETESNNKSFIAMQQEINELRELVVPKEKDQRYKRGEISTQVRQYIADSFVIIKKHVDQSKLQLEELISYKIQENLKTKSSISQNDGSKEKKSSNQKLYGLIKDLKEQIMSDMKQIQEICENKVEALRQTFTEKFKFLRESLAQQLLKQSSRQTCSMMSQIQKDRKKIEEAEKSQQQFLDKLQKTIDNIQDKLKAVKVGMVQNQKSFKKCLTQQLQNQQSKFQRQIQEHKQKIDFELLQIKNEVFNLNERIKVAEMSRKEIKCPGLSMIHSKQASNSEGVTKNSQNPQAQISVDDAIVEDFGNKSGYIRNQDILSLLEEKFGYLEMRNYSIEETVGQFVQIVKDIVEKMKYIDQA